MSYLNRLSLMFVIGLTALCTRAVCQNDGKYRVLTEWALSEQQKPVALFRTSEDELVKGVFDPQADTLLRAAETFTRAIFVFPGVAFRKAVTYKNGNVDIMLAEWNVEGPSVKGSVILKDTPIYSIYELRLNFRNVASREDLTSFLSDILVSGKPPLNLQPSLLQANLPAPPPGIIAFSGQFTVSESPLRDCSIAGVTSGGRWYVTLYVPKAFASSYYPDQQFVPERFPPLAELAKGWSFAQIWSELGRTTDLDNGMDLSRNRDAILIRELIRRGPTDDQFVELLVSASPAEQHHRAAIVFGELRNAGNSASLSAHFALALAGYERIGPTAESAVSVLFNEAARNCLPQVEAVALRKVKEGIFAESALGYLGRCSSSSETLTALDSLSLPDSVGRSKDLAARRIRGRIGNVLR